MLQQGGTLPDGGRAAKKQQQRQRQLETKGFRQGSSLKRSLRSPMVSDSPPANRQPHTGASMRAAPKNYVLQPHQHAAVPGEACHFSWCRGDVFDACRVVHGRLDCLASVGACSCRHVLSLPRPGCWGFFMGTGHDLSLRSLVYSGDLTWIIAVRAVVAARARRKSASEFSFPSSSASLEADPAPSTSSPRTAAVEASSAVPGATAAAATEASVGLPADEPVSAAAALAQQRPVAASTCLLTTPELLAALGSVGKLGFHLHFPPAVPRCELCVLP